MSNGQPPVPPPAPSSTPPPPGPAPSPGTAAQKQGLPTWAWVGIGCGCLLLIAAAVAIGGLGYLGKKTVDFAKEAEKNPAVLVEKLIQLNPEIEMVEHNQEEGTFTVRNVETGEVGTFDYSEIQSGRFSFEDDQGERTSVDASQAGESGSVKIETGEGQVTIGGGSDLKDVPGWVIFYPGAEAQRGGMTSVQGDKASGMVTAQTTDALEQVETWYQEKLEAEGYTVERNSVSFGGRNQVALIGKQEGRTLNVVIATDDGPETSVAVTYEGPKQ